MTATVAQNSTKIRSEVEAHISEAKAEVSKLSRSLAVTRQ